MTCFKINNLSSKLGSKKVSYKTLGRLNPTWKIKDVQNKSGINFIYESLAEEDVLNLSFKSCQKTLKKFNKNKIDCIIVVTQTAKNKLPSVSCILQEKLKLRNNIIAYDINMGCSGFIYGLSIINSLLVSKTVNNVLLVCSDTYTKYIDKNDRTCKTIFSDSASSCIINNAKSNFKTKFTFFTDGSGFKNLIENDNKITMNGSEVFFFTTSVVPKLFYQILKENNFKITEVDHFIFHQASKLVLEKLIEDLNIPRNKFHTNYNKIGNTTSASIPIILENLKKNKKIKKNDIVMMIGFGVGLSAAACIIKWQ